MIVRDVAASGVGSCCWFVVLLGLRSVVRRLLLVVVASFGAVFWRMRLSSDIFLDICLLYVYYNSTRRRFEVGTIDFDRVNRLIGKRSVGARLGQGLLVLKAVEPSCAQALHTASF